MNISWVQPLNLNGKLSGYNLHFFEEIGTEVFAVNDIGSNVILVITPLLSLVPFTMYFVNITATTGGGASEVSQSVITPEAGKFYLIVYWYIDETLEAWMFHHK